MNKKVMRGLAAALAAIGVYKLVQSQNGEREEREVWTTDEMPDLSGKVIIVTGANSGIGLEAAKAFARKGAQTVLACRSMEKAAAALTELQVEVPEAKAETMQLDFVRFARAKGLTEGMVRDRHAARTALLPVSTSLVLAVATVIDGGIITESIFGWPGMGQLLLASVVAEDIPVALAAFSFTGILALLGHFAADVLYGVLDPRIRVTSQG